MGPSRLRDRTVLQPGRSLPVLHGHDLKDKPIKKKKKKDKPIKDRAVWKGGEWSLGWPSQPRDAGNTAGCSVF